MRNLTAIFDWIVFSSTAAVILTGAIIFIKRLMRDKQSVKWHYYIWFILVIRLLIPYAPQSPISIFNTVTPAVQSMYYSESKVLNEKLPINNNVSDLSLKDDYIVNTASPSDMHNNSSSSSLTKMNLKLYFMFIWLLGVITFTIYTCYINLRLLLKTKKSKPTEITNIRGTLEQCKLLMGIQKDIPVFLESYVTSPSILGINKPVLLLPKDILDNINDNELKHIFLHELSHYKRKDNAIKYVILFLKMIYWFNPVIWYGFYKMQEDCELCCDYEAMEYMSKEEQLEYGYTILHMLKISSAQKRLLGAAGLLSGKSNIKRRIVMISQFNKKSFKFSAAGLVIISLLSFALFTNAKTNTAHADSSIKENVKALTTTLSSNSIDVKDIKGKNFNGKLMTISNPNKISVAYSLKDLKAYKTTSQIAKEENASAAINAGSFTMDQTPYGFIMKNGNVINNDSKDTSKKFPTAGLTKNGLLVVGDYSINELKNNDVRDAVVSGPALIINGKSLDTSNINLGINPRTAIAQKSDGTVLFLVIDGRSKNSIGASVKDVSEILLQNNAYNACLLDGGSSSTMYYNGNVINHPCDASGERKVPSAFVVLP
ncbi:phosphodiester glycosidase family protein [Clostridium sp. YIM B02515]|uniref:Phosphodiester glycosidase family protein n=1 Tax=Clostridium rhizosphaerae TaxID=2803861 RepID=A0ABS1TCF7_9CLOT|nr:M56 family metallopeptidase [Clostridium rhizosphaerae]MBL4937052.1 phosphodiester glycosidase family protein [Clostridium rhizosphaerae]